MLFKDLQLNFLGLLFSFIFELVNIVVLVFLISSIFILFKLVNFIALAFLIFNILVFILYFKCNAHLIMSKCHMCNANFKHYYYYSPVLK